MKKCINFPFRSTSLGGLTKYYVILDGKILRPSRKVRSKTERHGEDIYCLSDEEWGRTIVIGFYQSNSGKRSYDIHKIPKDIEKDKIEEILREWLYSEVDDYTIALTIANMLKLLKQNN